ncbi:immunity 22 family protein [Sporosarcina sp. FA15]|uniref:immunity 22 family protein n=1 Tax=Sporosarcina sp. FA15 TaxID=3413031 RepID=UPI003F65DA93
MKKQGWVSFWLGNIKVEDSIGEYVDLTYDEDGESVPSKFFIDFNIDMDETDEDTIEKAVYKNSSSDIYTLLAGCSYEEIIIPQFKESIDLKKSYNAVILIYNFEYNNEITSTNDFDFITTTNYEKKTLISMEKRLN